MLFRSNFKILQNQIKSYNALHNQLISSFNCSISYIYFSNSNYSTLLSIIHLQKILISEISNIIFNNHLNGFGSIHSCISSNTYKQKYFNCIFNNVLISLFSDSESKEIEEYPIFFQSIIGKLPRSYDLKYFSNDCIFNLTNINDYIKEITYFECNYTLINQLPNSLSNSKITQIIIFLLIFLLIISFYFYFRAINKIKEMNTQLFLFYKLLNKFCV